MNQTIMLPLKIVWITGQRAERRQVQFTVLSRGGRSFPEAKRRGVAGHVVDTMQF